MTFSSSSSQHIFGELPKNREVECGVCGMLMSLEGVEPLQLVECPGCRTLVLVPAIVDHFRLEALLGKGAMGRVYMAEDLRLRRRVAVKVLRHAFASTPRMWSQLEKEAKALASVNHNRVVQIYRLGKVNGRPYLVMEFVDNLTLEQRMEEGPVSEEEASRIASEVLEGLRAAHEVGLLHGDIKPANILLDVKGGAKVGDFGLARFVNQLEVEEWRGTPYYMAPEKCKQQSEDFRSDIYSLGATLFHVTSGHPPFEGETAEEVVGLAAKGPTPDLERYRPDLSEHFRAVVYRMMRLNPRDRYPDYDSALEAARGGKPERSPVGRRMRKQLRRFLMDSPAEEPPGSL